MVDRADKDPDAARHLRKILDAFLTKPQDRVLFDLYYDFPNESPWTPYVGGGLGVAITTLHYANQFIRKPDAE